MNIEHLMELLFICTSVCSAAGIVAGEASWWSQMQQLLWTPVFVHYGPCWAINLQKHDFGKSSSSTQIMPTCSLTSLSTFQLALRSVISIEGFFMLRSFGFASIFKHSTPDPIPKRFHTIKKTVKGLGSWYSPRCNCRHPVWLGRLKSKTLYRKCQRCTLLYAPLQECFCTYSVNIVAYGNQEAWFPCVFCTVNPKAESAKYIARYTAVNFH